MVNLAMALETVVGDLRQQQPVMSVMSVYLIKPIGMLTVALQSLPDNEVEAIRAAQAACRELSECAMNADCADAYDLAENLRDTVSVLYKVLADCARSAGISPLLIPPGGIIDGDEYNRRNEDSD